MEQTQETAKQQSRELKGKISVSYFTLQLSKNMETKDNAVFYIKSRKHKLCFLVIYTLDYGLGSFRVIIRSVFCFYVITLLDNSIILLARYMQSSTTVLQTIYMMYYV